MKAQSASRHSTPLERRVKKSCNVREARSFGGNKSSGSTRRALARQSSSKSETHRICVSIFASVCRLKSHPHRRQRAASIGCDNLCWSRNRRISNPTIFRGFFFMFRFRNSNARKNAALKGSEFRTICLAKTFEFVECQMRAPFLGLMERKLKEVTNIHRIVMYRSFSRLKT